MEKQNTTFNGGGGGGAGVKASVEQQNKLLALTKNLSNSNIEVPEITTDDVIQNNEKFAATFDTLIKDVDLDTMNDQQFQNLKNDIANDVDNKFRLSLGDLVVPKLDDLSSPQFDRRMINITKTGICESLNGGSCPTIPGKPKSTQGLQGMNDALNKKADATNKALGTANLFANKSILDIVNDTNKAIRHSNYGLEKVQDFASTAWESVHGDKIMSAITTTLVVHNAIMLSGNLLQTTGEAASVALNAIGLKDENLQPFDVGEIVQGKIKEILTNYLGEENYQALTKRIAAANRIYQASANILDTTQGLFDSAHTIAEIAASNTGKIGNGLREAGVVYEDAYDEMLEKVSPQNAAMRKLEKFRQGLDSIEEGVSNVSTISSEVVDIKENWEQLKKEKEDWNTEVEKAIEEQQQEKDDAKQEVQVGADIQETDFDAAPSDT